MTCRISAGKRVVVVGGGNVAMDVARSAVRLGAESVTIAYRRRKVDMTALPEEVEGAIAEGCEVLDLHAPLRIEKDRGRKSSRSLGTASDRGPHSGRKAQTYEFQPAGGQSSL